MKPIYFFLACLVSVFFLLPEVLAFNIEDRIPLVKKGPKNSLFGLSVAEHYMAKKASTLNDITLLVGAPTAAAASHHDSSIVNPGGLFRCAINSNQNCQRVKIDDSKPSLEVNISNSWLGVTVQSQKPGGKVAVCAHRYTIHGGSSGAILWEAEIGRCFVLDRRLRLSDSFTNIFEPCSGKVTGRSYSHAGFGYCQAGTSFAFAPNVKQDIVLGLPGTMHWTGGIYSNQINSELFFPEFLYSNENEQPQIIKQNSYMGFSVDSGFNLTNPLFVAGAPRGADNGQVVIFEKVRNKNNDIILNISEILTGEVLASSFGYAVKVADVNGDDRDDLIVGAPQYYDRLDKVGGAVYVYINNGLNKLGPNATTVLYGELDSAFGNSITSLGDINMDGINDIAIGAPGDDGGAGRVYIYHGSPNGIHKQPSQVIKGTGLAGTDNLAMKGFGYSMSGGLDMDLNGYPDLAVGSLSDVAVLLRSRPIVNVKGYLTASVSKININAKDDANPNVYNFTDPATLQIIKFVAFNITVCMNYTSVPKSFDEFVDVKYIIKLDALRLEEDLRPRVTFFPSKFDRSVKSEELRLPPQSAQKNTCVSTRVYLDNNMQDKLSPFVMSLSYDVIDKNISDALNQDQLVSLGNYPILNKNLKPVVNTQVNISKNCGSDEVCKSNLTMKAQYVVLYNGKSQWETLNTVNGITTLFVGAEKEIGIKVSISNDLPGEDAHQAKLKVLLPKFTSYIGLNTDVASVSCRETKDNTSLVICAFGNPFQSGKDIVMSIKFDNKPLSEVNAFVVKASLSTSSTQTGLEFISYPVTVKFQAHLKIDGYAENDQIPFGGDVIGESAVKKPLDAGLYVNQVYEVENVGTTEVTPVTVTIEWPYLISNGKWLFYLLSVSSSENMPGSNATCRAPVGSLNPLNLNEEAIDSSKRSKRSADAVDSQLPLEPASVLSSDVSKLFCPESAQCVNITCDLGLMLSEKIVYIKIRGIVWNSTFLEEYNGTVDIQVYSSAYVSVDRGNVLYSSSSVRRKQIVTSVFSQKINISEHKVEFWIIALASGAGVILLVIIVLLLWRCGFFKRRRDHGDFHKAHKHRQASKKADESSEKFINY